MDNSSKDRPFITTGEIVKLAEVHPNTVAIWRSTGKIVPKDRIGASFLYDRAEVLKFLKEREEKSKKKRKKK